MSQFMPAPDGRWVDLDPVPPIIAMMPPNKIIRAANVINTTTNYFHSQSRLDLTTLNWDQPPTRRMTYSDSSGNVRQVRLRLTRLPTGSSTITIGSKSTSATTGVVTYTPSKEGYLLAVAGTLVPTGSAPRAIKEIAGLLLPKYCTELSQDLRQDESTTVVDLQAGDVFWTIMGGDVQLYTHGAVNDGDPINSSGTTAGASIGAPAIDTSAVANFNTTGSKRYAWGPDTYCLGSFKETTGGAGLANAWLDLLRPEAYRIDWRA